MKKYVSPEFEFKKVCFVTDVLSDSADRENSYVDIGDIGGGDTPPPPFGVNDVSIW